MIIFTNKASKYFLFLKVKYMVLDFFLLNAYVINFALSLKKHIKRMIKTLHNLMFKMSYI